MADLARIGTDEHRHALPVASLQRGIGVDINRLDCELQFALKWFERTQHVFAQMAVGTPVKGEAHHRSAFVGEPWDRDERSAVAAPHLERDHRVLVQAHQQLV